MKIEFKLNQEQFDLLLNSLVQVAQGVHRLSDTWEGKGKETDIIGDIFVHDDEKEAEKPKRHYTPRSVGDIGARTVMQRLGMKLNMHLFRAACASVKVKPFKHGNDHHLFIKQKDEEKVAAVLKKYIK